MTDLECKLFPFCVHSLRDYVVVHGRGYPSGPGVKLAKRLYDEGSSYTEIAREVVDRGLLKSA